MLKLVFATNNQHKVDEVRSILKKYEQLQIVTLRETGIDIDIPEPHDTLEANASEKSATIHAITGLSCFSEDTGLEVAALDNQPGVKSARYAGENRDFQANIDKLMSNLQVAHDRTARFRTVISLIWNNKEYLFEGICKGAIALSQHGKKGFGYDPVFIPDGSTKTFAEMTIDEKNTFSHRKKAMAQLIDFLSQQGI